MRHRRIGSIGVLAALLASGCSASSDLTADPTSASASATDPVADSVPVTVPSVTTAAPPGTVTVPPETATATTAATTTTTSPTEPPVTEAELQELVATDLARLGNAPGQIVSVLVPSRGVDLTVAAGTELLDGGAALTAASTVRLTSVTKTYVAAATFRLVETGAIAADDSLADVGISVELVDLLRSDGYDVDAITVGQMMTHTSGIADYAGSSDYTTSPYTERNLADPAHAWTREEQVTFAVDTYDPVAAPGAEYHYSDTNYVLLGDLLERNQGTGLGDAMRSLIGVDAFGPATTHFEILEPTPPGAGPRAGQYFGTFDARNASPTIDLYGGGGLVASMPETARFFHALGTGGVFADTGTFAAMSEVTVPGSVVGAASGLYRLEFDGVECFGHGGFYGTFAMVCPALDLAVARAWNQALLDDAAALDLLATEIVALFR